LKLEREQVIEVNVLQAVSSPDRRRLFSIIILKVNVIPSVIEWVVALTVTVAGVIAVKELTLSVLIKSDSHRIPFRWWID
jgi:hypothetical protein